MSRTTPVDGGSDALTLFCIGRLRGDERVRGDLGDGPALCKVGLLFMTFELATRLQPRSVSAAVIRGRRVAGSRVGREAAPSGSA